MSWEGAGGWEEGETDDESSALFLVGVGKEEDGVEDLNASVGVDVNIFIVRSAVQNTCVPPSKSGTKKKISLNASHDATTHTSAKAAWTAALRTFTATTGLRAATAVSNGSRAMFS